MIAAIIAGIVAVVASAVAGGVQSGMNYNAQKDAAATANQNFMYQQTLQQQQYEEQKKLFASATQTKVADLKAAGLSPTLAAGQASQVAQMPSLAQQDTRATEMNLNSATAPLTSIVNMLSMAQGIAQSQAQTKLTELQQNKTILEGELIGANKLKTIAETSKIGSDNAFVNKELEMYRKYGVSPRSSGWGGVGRDARGMMDAFNDEIYNRINNIKGKGLDLYDKTSPYIQKLYQKIQGR